MNYTNKKQKNNPKPASHKSLPTPTNGHAAAADEVVVARVVVKPVCVGTLPKLVSSTNDVNITTFPLLELPVGRAIKFVPVTLITSPANEHGLVI